MTRENRIKIISNEYANAIVEYHRRDSFMAQFSDDLLNIIDEKYGVVYFPAIETTISIAWENGYAMIPKLYGLLNKTSLEALGVDRVQSIPYLGLQGAGVLLGFVDTGIDYTSPLFQNADRTTRILSIWDQSIENLEAGADIFYYGTEYTSIQINEALASENPYALVPSADEIGHGTMLAGVAGGAEDTENDFRGIVPFSEFVVVKLKQAKKNVRDYFYIPDEAICFQEDDIMFGIQYLINAAQSLQRPIAICIGLGTSQGAHDGNDYLSQFIAKTGSFTGRGVIIAAGNEGNSKKHYFGSINAAAGYQDVELMVGKNELGFAMELWGYAPATYSIDMLSPGGQYVPQILPRLGESRSIRFLLENTVAQVDYLLIEAQSGAPFILIRFITPAPGVWKFRVYAGGSENLSFHIWLPINEFLSDRTFFLNPSPDTTVTSPGNAAQAVTITAYDPAMGSIYLNAGRGFSRNNIIKPDVAAPGVNVTAPVPGNQFTRATGTSVAAALATGVAAMLFEWGIVRGNFSAISSIQLQRFFIRGAEKDPDMLYPNQLWGYGILNIYQIFISLTIGLQ